MQSHITTIGVTGTPGCGKTTLCSNLPFQTITIEDLAKKYDCTGPTELDGAASVDTEKLSKLWQKPTELTIVDGHLSHFLPVDALIILRCHPDILRQRLGDRGYTEEKIQENVEYELMGGVWSDLLDDTRPKIEGDSKILDWISSGCPHITSPFDAIDWISEI